MVSLVSSTPESPSGIVAAIPSVLPALLPLPLQHLGQRLATEVPLILVRKLANGEIYFLLASARSTERYAQDLHLCATGARLSTTARIWG
jgi:hypothetical protein